MTTGSQSWYLECLKMDYTVLHVTSCYHTLYGIIEQKADLDTHAFILFSNILENFPGENQVPKNLLGFFPSLFVVWPCSLGICLAFQVGSTIYDWQWPPLLRHQHKLFLHMTYRTYPPLSGQSLIFSSNFQSRKTWWLFLRWQISPKLPPKNGFWI